VPRPAKLFHFLNGEELTIADWAKRYGLETAMVKTRIYRMRWSLERALTTPKLVRGVQPKPKRTEIVAKEVREAKLCCEAFRVWSGLAPPLPPTATPFPTAPNRATIDLITRLTRK
jgi:hypothetical protein